MCVCVSPVGSALLPRLLFLLLLGGPAGAGGPPLVPAKHFPFLRLPFLPPSPPRLGWPALLLRASLSLSAVDLYVRKSLRVLESRRQTKPKKGVVHELFPGQTGTKVRCQLRLFSQRKNTRNSPKMGEIHELFVLALFLVWFAGATPDPRAGFLHGLAYFVRRNSESGSESMVIQISECMLQEFPILHGNSASCSENCSESCLFACLFVNHEMRFRELIESSRLLRESLRELLCESLFAHRMAQNSESCSENGLGFPFCSFSVFYRLFFFSLVSHPYLAFGFLLFVVHCFCIAFSLKTCGHYAEL